jgi:hypothetical protein
MLRHILQAKFKLPPDLSPSCKALISFMLDPVPATRIGLDQILLHPWVTQTPSSIPRVNSMVGRLFAGIAPRQRRPSIEDISKTSEASSTKSHEGIVSPFADRETVARSGLPALVAKPASLGVRAKIGEPGQLCSLAQNRQRSAGSLVARMAIPMSKSAQVLETISEDESALPKFNRLFADV